MLGVIVGVEGGFGVELVMEVEVALDKTAGVGVWLESWISVAEGNGSSEAGSVELGADKGNSVGAITTGIAVTEIGCVATATCMPVGVDLLANTGKRTLGNTTSIKTAIDAKKMTVPRIKGKFVCSSSMTFSPKE